MSPTPETDALIMSFTSAHTVEEKGLSALRLAKKLERQLDEARGLARKGQQTLAFLLNPANARTPRLAAFTRCLQVEAEIRLALNPTPGGDEVKS